MNLLRLLLIVLLGWLLARWLKTYLDKKSQNSAKISGGAQTESDLVKCDQCGTYYAKSVSHMCKSGSSTAASLLIFAVLLAAVPAPAMAAGGGRYLVEVTASNLSVSVEVNGIKAENWSFARETTAGASFNHWLRQGNNTLVLKASAQGGARAQIKARVYFLGATAAGGVQLVNLLEVDDLAKAQRGASVSFNLSASPSLNLWQTAAPSEPLRAQQAVMMVGALRSELISVMAVGGGFEDVKSLDIERKDMQRAFGGTATSQPLAIAPQSPQARLEVSVAPGVADLAVDTVGSPGLLRIGRRDGSPLVVIKRNGQAVAVPTVIVGWIDGAWHILRRGN